jgi:hypothetical protein
MTVPLADPAGMLAALADPMRLRLLADIADAGAEGCNVDDLSREELTARELRDHVARLAQTGLVESGGRGVVARLDRMQQTSFALASGEDPEVAAYFDEEGKLSELPRASVTRRFEEGRTYSEAEVSALLYRVHYDYNGLRRHMLDFGILERDRRGMQYRLRRDV